MRVLLVSPTSVPGGAERALASLARRLPELGFHPRAVLLQRGPLEGWLADAGCPVEVIEAGRTRQLHRAVSTVAKLTLRARNADVVLSNQSKGHVYGGLAAFAARRPAVWWQQGTPERSPIEQAAARVPAAVIVASSQASVAAQRRLTPHRRIELVHLGVNLDSVRAYRGSGNGLRATHGWAGCRLVGIVGRLQEWKGQDVFLRAAARVAEAHPATVFIVVGGAILGWEGEYPEQLRHLATALGIEHKVNFVGHQDDVYPWFDMLDVVVHASFGEPFGLVILEAMALGKAVVATAAGGPTEIVEDGASGLLVPPGDDEAMAAAINRILCGNEFRTKLEVGAAARADAFDETLMAERLAGIFREVAQPSAPRTPQPVSSDLVERTVPGLHEHVFREIIQVRPRGRVIDIGAGSGAFAERLATAGFDVLAADRDEAGFLGAVLFRAVDLDETNWAGALGIDTWPLVTALEVIEHLEAPIAFLRNIAALLAPEGLAVITTPNVDSLPARAKFLIRDRLRLLDEHGDPTHISPIFWDLLVRQYLPRAGLKLLESSVYPRDGFVVGRPVYRRLLRPLRPFLQKRQRLLGDNHVLVVARASG